jgi:hypothetical protein
MLFSQASPTNPAIFTTKVGAAGAEPLFLGPLRQKNHILRGRSEGGGAAETRSLVTAQNGASVAAPIASYCGAKLTTMGNWVYVDSLIQTRSSAVVFVS